MIVFLCRSDSIFDDDAVNIDESDPFFAEAFKDGDYDSDEDDDGGRTKKATGKQKQKQGIYYS